MVEEQEELQRHQHQWQNNRVNPKPSRVTSFARNWQLEPFSLATSPMRDATVRIARERPSGSQEDTEENVCHCSVSPNTRVFATRSHFVIIVPYSLCLRVCKQQHLSALLQKKKEKKTGTRKSPSD